MAIVINGSGTVTGLAVGGLPDGTVDAGTLATDSVVTGKIADGTIANADINDLAASKLTGALPAISGASLTNLPSGGKVLQIVNYQTATVNTGTTTIPNASAEVTITMGNQYMTLAITPTSATSKLRIDFVVHSSPSSGAVVTGALFQDSTTNALAANGFYMPTGTGTGVLSNTYHMVSGTTSATTFRVRVGMSSSGTLSFNGANGGTRFGSAVKSSITITEYEV